MLLFDFFRDPEVDLHVEERREVLQHADGEVDVVGLALQARGLKRRGWVLARLHDGFLVCIDDALAAPSLGGWVRALGFFQFWLHQIERLLDVVDRGDKFLSKSGAFLR